MACHPAAVENAMWHYYICRPQGSKTRVLLSSCASLFGTMCGCFALIVALIALALTCQDVFISLALLMCCIALRSVRTYLAAPFLRCCSRQPRQRAFTLRTRRVVLFLMLFICLARPTRSAFVASSRISYCSDPGDEKMNCTRKIVVTVTVEGGQLPNEESLVFLNSARDMTVGLNGTPVEFSPIHITTSRSAVRYRYPLFYVQNYNAKPYEAFVKGALFSQCNAEFSEGKATCGIAYDLKGKAIAYSQGFCCECSMCQTVGFCPPSARARAACSVAGDFTTASCLRFGDRWYSGYSIGSYVTWYTLNLTLSRNASRGSHGVGSAKRAMVQKAVMHLSPSNKGDRAGSGWDVSAAILGNYAPSDQPFDFSSHMMFVPAMPQDDPRLTAGAAEWMLLPSHFVTLNGRECNKIGTSYEAFVSQGNMCSLSPGSCLKSQLEDYRTADLGRIAAGKKGLYMATSVGNFSFEDRETPSPFLSYFSSSPAATMVSITASADDLEYIVGLASGKIVSAAVNKPVLEADSRDGVMTVVVRNTASVTGRLVVGTLNCSSGVFPMTAQVLSLSAQQESALTFNVYMQNNKTPRDASCTVVVRNAEEVITDSRIVSWKVSSTMFTNGTQGGSADREDATSTEESSAVSCKNCRKLDMSCAVNRFCLGLVFLNAFVYLLIAAAVVCVFFFRRTVCCCFYGEASHSHGDHHSGNNGNIHSKAVTRPPEDRSRVHQVSGSASSSLRPVAQASLTPPRSPLVSSIMSNPAMMYRTTSPFSTFDGRMGLAPARAFPAAPVPVSPHLSAIAQSLVLSPPSVWYPYGGDAVVFPEEDRFLAAHDFPSLPPESAALFRSPLTPLRETRVGSLCNGYADIAAPAFPCNPVLPLWRSPFPECHSPDM
ncbi:hypothetical protein JKF63_01047 [Porcisia hertigi]|uniref:Generative cell specific-1/HAP2 domain-containing protein n=1 Tax=Porcisia hertigi TaxID=2761500 RepID=A0A836KZ91_9TRYP|nr:hypothetical protein JKF63_01047 [Porcisia hertigi]